MPKSLKDWRLQLGLTQTQLAQALHLSVQSIQNWEQGRTIPRNPFALEAHLEKLAAARARLIDDGGPGALVVWTAKDIAKYRRGDAWPVFYRDITTGNWIDGATVASLPTGATWWETEADGIWYKMRSNGPKFGRSSTGIKGPFPPYRPWDTAAQQSL